MPGHQDRWNRHAAPFPGARVLRVFKQAVGKAFLFCRGVIAQDPRQESHCCIDKRLCCDLSSGQDKVAKTDFDDAVMVDYPLVEPFEAAADQADTGTGGKALGHVLRKGAASWAEIDQRAARRGARAGM